MPGEHGENQFKNRTVFSTVSLFLSILCNLPGQSEDRQSETDDASAVASASSSRVGVKPSKRPPLLLCGVPFERCSAFFYVFLFKTEGVFDDCLGGARALLSSFQAPPIFSALQQQQ